MKIIDLNDINNANSMHSKVCIVGSGPAGCVLAVELANQGIEVILLEEGNNLPNYDISSVADNVLISNASKLRFGWSKQFGGSSHLWSGRSYPMEPIDFMKRDWVENSGWPFPFSEIEPYYKSAAKLIGIPNYDYFTPYREIIDKNKNLLSEISDNCNSIEMKCFQWAQSPMISSDYLRNTIEEQAPLIVILNSPVRNLLENEKATSVEKAILTKLDGSLFEITADYFVLAAGGIETPRILLNSNQVSPNGIGNDRDVVGRFFSTHPKADMAAVIFNKPISTSHAFFVDRPLENGSYRYGVGLSKEVQEKIKTLNHYVQLSPLLEYRANQAFEFIKRTKALNNSLINSNKLIQGFLPGLGKLIYEFMGRIANIQPKTRKFILRGFLDQYPNRENRIILSDSKKSDGTYKAEIQWRFSESDRKSVLDFFSYLDETLKKNNIGHIEYSGLKDCEDWPLISIHSHFMGATRMGSDKETSVTNKNAKVHGKDNLYISGPSLFPTYGFANPFFTIVALSLKLSDHLSREIKQ